MKADRKRLALVPLDPALASLLALLFTHPKLIKLEVNRSIFRSTRLRFSNRRGTRTDQRLPASQEDRLMGLMTALGEQLTLEVQPTGRWHSLFVRRSGTLTLVPFENKYREITRWRWRNINYAKNNEYDHGAGHEESTDTKAAADTARESGHAAGLDIQ